MFDSLIADAPEVSEIPAPEPAPWKDEKPAEQPTAPTPLPAPVEDTFHSDPLIQAALVKFEGKVLN